MDTTLRLSENTRQGFDGLKAAFCLGSMEAKSNDASGLRLRLRRKCVRTRCTGQKRDNETGLDYFGARYFSAPLGRFTSPDKPLLDQHVADPQSWNLYVYARNNPLLYIDPTGNEIELLGDEDEREKELELLKRAMKSDKVASFLYIKSVKKKDKTQYLVGIKGDVGEFAGLSETAKDLAGLVSRKETVDFGITNQDLSKYGGAVTLKPGEVGNENVRVLVNPNQMDITTRKLSPNASYLSAWRWGGQDGPRSERWTVQPATKEIAAWHEFGHANEYLNLGWFGRIFSGFSATNKESLDWENRMREQLYGPSGPNNAPRIRH